jgi:ribosomal protein S18 acetylase RimI-like enzyme
MAFITTSPRIRSLTEHDRDTWIDIARSGYEIDPQFQWRRPYRNLYPEDTAKAMIRMFDEAMTLPKTISLVAEIQDQTGDWIIVGLSVWEWKDSEDSSMSGIDRPEDQKRDMDPVRQKKFVDAVIAAETKYFGPLGDIRLEAVDIVVHPKYHRRGIGKALMNWGMDLATEKKVPITLTASPMGKLLYSYMGFKELGVVDCEVAGDDGKKAWTYAMIWMPKGRNKYGCH